MLVTIITVAYNAESTISRTIESVMGQTYNEIEYFIIDGKSTDKTVEIARSYQDRFYNGKMLRVISEPDNGMYDALNKGINRATGILVGNINADDWYEPDAVEEMVNLYQEKEYDIAWADLMIHNGNHTFIKKAKVGKIWTTAHFCHPTMVATKEILMKYPYLSKHMDDDFDMILRANNGGAKIVTLNKVLAHYSFGGMSTQKSLCKMRQRIGMKYSTYIRNGYSRLYWFYCVAVEGAKFLLGG